MSLTREEQFSLYDKIHPKLLMLLLKAISSYVEKSEGVFPTLFPLMNIDKELGQYYSDYIEFLQTDASMLKDRMEQYIDKIGTYMDTVMFGIELSITNDIPSFIKSNIKKLKSKQCQDALQQIKESKSFPTKEIYNDSSESKPFFILLHAFDILTHSDINELKKFPICKNIDNLNVEAFKSNIQIMSLEAKVPHSQNRNMLLNSNLHEAQVELEQPPPKKPSLARSRTF